ncbi:MAG: substrate-binding domain-containing protein [Bacteroidetes bacterium]|nr:substrate-binding domain-containing protein [Bacteroidota bacterium]
MKMQRQIISVLAVITVFATVVLISFINQEPARRIEVENVKIEVILKSTDYSSIPFWDVVRQGLETAAEDFQAQIFISGPNAETEIDLQIQLVYEALAREPDAIILAAADYKRLISTAEDIISSGIPLITIDSFIDSDAPVSRIGTDNYSAGLKAGHIMKDYISEGSQIAIISYVKESSTAIDREKGVRESLDDYVDIVGTWYSGGNIQVASQHVLTVLEENPDLQAIIALNEPSTVGSARALESSGRESEIVLIGFDNSSPIIQYLEQEVIQAIVVQKPFNMGYLGVTYAVDAVNGKKIPEVIDTGSEIITKDTMYTSENQKLLFPVNRE